MGRPVLAAEFGGGSCVEFSGIAGTVPYLCWPAASMVTQAQEPGVYCGPCGGRVALMAWRKMAGTAIATRTMTAIVDTVSEAPNTPSNSPSNAAAAKNTDATTRPRRGLNTNLPLSTAEAWGGRRLSSILPP